MVTTAMCTFLSRRRARRLCAAVSQTRGGGCRLDGVETLTLTRVPPTLDPVWDGSG